MKIEDGNMLTRSIYSDVWNALGGEVRIYRFVAFFA